MGSRVTHVPFPNTLVKPSSAYGSAAHCSARVGRRQAFLSLLSLFFYLPFCYFLITTIALLALLWLVYLLASLPYFRFAFDQWSCVLVR